MYRLGIGIALASLSCSVAVAHHSYSEYDDKQLVEIEGTLVGSALQNPHIHFSVEVKRADGKAVLYNVEATTLNWVQRTNVPLELFDTGGRVKFAGWPSRRSDDRMYALNMLTATGQEIVLFRNVKPRWGTTALGFASDDSRRLYEGGVAAATDSVFRVWASDLDDLGFRTTPSPLPLTDAAKRALAAFDPIRESTLVGCTPKGMPVVMIQPPPIEIIDRGDTILIRTEEYDTVRTIHMTGSAATADLPRSALGHSIGRREGTTLVVETTRVNYPYLNQAGVPQGPDARFVERFMPAADGSRLDYSLTVTDPHSLLASAEMVRHWVWRPGEQVLPFDCKAQ